MNPFDAQSDPMRHELFEELVKNCVIAKGKPYDPPSGMEPRQVEAVIQGAEDKRRKELSELANTAAFSDIRHSQGLDLDECPQCSKPCSPPHECPADVPRGTQKDGGTLKGCNCCPDCTKACSEGTENKPV